METSQQAETIPVRVERNGRNEWMSVDGVVLSDYFAITRTIDFEFKTTRMWSVTHRQSGHCVPFIRRKRDAIKLATFIETKGRELGISWKLKTQAGLKKRGGANWQKLAAAVREFRDAYQQDAK